MIATAYVLISVGPRMARKVYEALGRMQGVQQVDVVSGPYDLIAVVQGGDFLHIGKLVLDRIQHIDGVTDTVTCSVIPVEQ